MLLEMDRPCDAVVIGSTVYFRAGRTTKICTYDWSSGKWCPLPTSPRAKSCALAVVNNLLTTIGGRPETNDFCYSAILTNNIVPLPKLPIILKNYC